mgnify:CR=1 FL=1
MKNRYEIVVTESIDSYIEIETEQDYTKSQLRQIVHDVMDREQMATKDWKCLALYPNICSGRLLDIRKNGKDM